MRKFILFLCLGTVLLSEVRLSSQGSSVRATQASILAPAGLAIDRDENLLILETSGLRVRKVDPKTQTITTIIGIGKRCCFTEGEPATTVALEFPLAIAVDAGGGLFVADSAARVYRVDPKSGLISTVVRQTWGSKKSGAEDLLPHLPGTESVMRLALNHSDPNSPLYILSNYGKIYRLVEQSLSEFLTAQDERELRRYQLFSPSGIAVDSSGDLVVADQGSCRILRIDSRSKSIAVLGGTGACKSAGGTGSANTLALNHPTAVAVDSRNNVYFTAAGPYCVGKIDAETNLLTSIPGTCDIRDGKMWAPSAITVDDKDSIYIAFWRSNVVKRVNMNTGMAEIVAGNGRPDRVIVAPF